MIEIFTKSLAAFAESGLPGNGGSGLVYLVGTATFFIGIIAVAVLEILVHWIMKRVQKLGTRGSTAYAILKFHWYSKRLMR